MGLFWACGWFKVGVAWFRVAWAWHGAVGSGWVAAMPASWQIWPSVGRVALGRMARRETVDQKVRMG